MKLYDIVTPSLETYLNKKASINCPLQITLMYEVGLECQCLPLTIYLETFSGKIILKHSFSMQISSHLQKSLDCRTKSSIQTLTSNPSRLRAVSLFLQIRLRAMHAPSVTRHQSRAWPFLCLAFCSTDYRKKRDCSQSKTPQFLVSRQWLSQYFLLKLKHRVLYDMRDERDEGYSDKRQT